MTFPVHHLAFRTRDVTTLARFYGDVLGLATVRDEAPRAVWLALGPGAVLMIEKREAGEPGLPAGSMDLVALRVDSATRAAVRERAVAMGCHEGATQFTDYLRDPDGRRLGVSTYDLSFVKG